MTNTTKPTIVTLSPDLVEKCDAYARQLVSYYTNNGDKLTAMPWTRDQMTLAEFELWVASRKEAGLKIDIETCELGRWYAHDLDPYGVLLAKGELPDELQQIGTNRFVRSSESRGWVHEGDLPTAKGQAIYDRIGRDYYVRPRKSWRTQFRNIVLGVIDKMNSRGCWQTYWMRAHGIPPVPVWFADWFLAPLVERYLARRRDDDDIPF